jgi:hypothetical protein
LQLRHAKPELARRVEYTLELDRRGLGVANGYEKIALEQGRLRSEKHALAHHLDRLVDRAEPFCGTTCER